MRYSVPDSVPPLRTKSVPLPVVSDIESLPITRDGVVYHVQIEKSDLVGDVVRKLEDLINDGQGIKVVTPKKYLLYHGNKPLKIDEAAMPYMSAGLCYKPMQARKRVFSLSAARNSLKRKSAKVIVSANTERKNYLEKRLALLLQKRENIVVEESRPCGKFTDPVKLMAKIGGGASGQVYRCIVNGWMCAMKEVEIQRGDGETNDEIDILEALPNHKNILKYHGYKKTEETFQICMKEYQSTLDKLITERKEANEPFAAEEVAHILSHVAEGLAELHENKIIHRDIKSHNIFIEMPSPDADVFDCTFVIGDFDSATRVAHKKDKPNSVIGTPCFMAPEILSCEEEIPYSYPVDIFSYGMLIYELLTLSLPYNDIVPYKVATTILEGKRPKLPHMCMALMPYVRLHKSTTQFEASNRPSSSDLITYIEETRNQTPRSSHMFTH